MPKLRLENQFQNVTRLERAGLVLVQERLDVVGRDRAAILVLGHLGLEHDQADGRGFRSGDVEVLQNAALIKLPAGTTDSRATNRKCSSTSMSM